jgi:hypothetical protein
VAAIVLVIGCDDQQEKTIFMTNTAFKRIALIMIAGCCIQFVHAVDATASAPLAAPGKKAGSSWVFSLLPKAFQKNPRLAISIITEMTEEGRKIKPPTPDSPAYYNALSAGFHHEGGGAEGSVKVPEENLKKQVRKALAVSGYLQGDLEHPPLLLLVFFWGVHTKLEQNDIETGEGGTPDIGNRNLLSRAQLVGGVVFAKELAKALQEQAMTGASGSSPFDPVYQFANRDDLTRNLMEQILDDCYYVVISAYDNAAFVRGERKLLWRTKMSTPAQGIALDETAPALVASGADFFGREMATSSLVDKRITRGGGGRVDLGPLEIKGYIDTPEKKETPPAKK